MSGNFNFNDVIISLVFLYFGILLLISWLTGRSATSHDFYAGSKKSLWYVVALGMVGTSLSGVTFISVPGTVGPAGFSYFQVVLGYFIGYFVVAYVLLPLYYRLNLTSIYHYLGQRFGTYSYKTGALFFIISRTLGATLRLYLVVNVLHVFVLEKMGISFHIAALGILLMILLYTLKGGVKTIVWTDTLQTVFMLSALIICVWYILSELGLSASDALSQLESENLTRIFNTDPLDKGFFIKQIVGGAFVTISMTGLDQEMMQKNISVKTLKDSQKNMISFSVVMVLVNFLFLLLGGVLYLYANAKGLDLKGDDLFPKIALEHLPDGIAIIFVIGLISALFPSADGAITALTSSFCIDILGLQRNKDLSEKQKSSRRMTVHLIFAVIFLLFVYFFKELNNKSIINILLDIAGYTYGPLLGLFAFGILSKRHISDSLAPIVCILAPVLSYLLQYYAPQFLGSYKIGIELLIINGLLTYLGLLIISVPGSTHELNTSPVNPNNILHDE